MQGLSTYAFINAKVRAMISKFLSPDQLNKLIQARDIEDAIAVFKDTPYAAFIRIDVLHEKGLEFIERELWIYDISLHQIIIRGLSADGAIKKIVTLLKERYELDQIKVLLRIWNNKEKEEGRQNFVHTFDVNRVLAARNVDELAAAFINTPFAKPILAGKEKYLKIGSLFYIEAALDRDYFDRLWREIDRLPLQDRQIAARMAGIEIDIENISGLIRLKEYYGLSFAEAASLMLPRGFKSNEQLLRGIFNKEVGSTTSQSLAGGRYHDLAGILGKGTELSQLRLMEGVLTQALIQEAHKLLAGYPFTIGTILAYLILKRVETRNIISILYSKSYDMQPEQIRGILC